MVKDYIGEQSSLFKGPLSVSSLSSLESTRVHSQILPTFTLVIEGHKGHQVDAAQAAQDEVPRVKDTRPIIPVFGGHGLRFTIDTLGTTHRAGNDVRLRCPLGFNRALVVFLID